MHGYTYHACRPRARARRIQVKQENYDVVDTEPEDGHRQEEIEEVLRVVEHIGKGVTLYDDPSVRQRLIANKRVPPLLPCPPPFKQSHQK